MRPAPGQGRRLRQTAAVMAACSALGACVTGSSAASGGPAALFRAPVGETSDAVAPGLNSGWYVERRPVQFAQVGMAGWSHGRPRAGLGAWLGWLLRHGGAADPKAVVAVSSGLPVPSIIQVTDLRTFRTITVRVEQKARLERSLVLLPPEAARALGVDGREPLQVRIRYSAPVLAYEERPTLRYALLGPARPASAPILTAARDERPPRLPQVAAPAPLAIPPPPAARLAEAAPLLAARLRPALDADPPAGAHIALFHIQAGAFAELANARHAVAMLAPAGEADIVPTQRGTTTLYRVVLDAGRTAERADQLRARVARIGFPDAEVLRPS